MQTQNITKKDREQSTVRVLLMDWLIVLCIYISIRLVFILFGFTLNTTILGGCLAVMPYLFSALYLWKCHTQQKTWFYALGVLSPSIIEKVAMYLLGAYLYSLSPANVTGVMQAIGSHELYVNFLTTQSALYLINISFFNWTYIFCSIAFSVLCVVSLVKIQKKKIVKE